MQIICISRGSYGVGKELADKQGKPPYVIFGDAALLDMCRLTPTNETTFMAVNGVGQAKLERYGSQFMAAIAGHLDGTTPPA